MYSNQYNQSMLDSLLTVSPRNPACLSSWSDRIVRSSSTVKFPSMGFVDLSIQSSAKSNDLL